MHSSRRLARYLCLSHVVLTLYVCLHPFSGWSMPGLPPLAFLIEPWQKYISRPDVFLNVLGFIPFGFMLAASLPPRRKPGRSVVWITLASFALSFAIEFAQNWLPGRVSSNLDLATNTLGGLLGALAGLRWGHVFADHGLIQRWRTRHLLPGRIGELGLLLIALWGLSQLEPGTLLFGAGDLRLLFDLPAPLAFSARRYQFVEMAAVASYTLALAMLWRSCTRAVPGWTYPALLIAALALRSLADMLFLQPADPWLWATPGALRGLALGVLLALIASRLPRWSQHSLANLTLLLSTALVNLAPENPFISASVRTVQQGHFLNFYGLTQLVTAIWPFLALTWLSVQAGLRR